MKRFEKGGEMDRTALVIQEDLITRKILKKLVTSQGFSCMALASLNDLDFFEVEHGLDVVITDILFDGIGPLDFAVQIQEAIPQKNLLIVTHMGQERIRKDLMKIKGVSGFFGVPFDLDQIEAKLRKL